MKAPADFPTVSCDRKFETRVSSMMMARTPARLLVDLDRRRKRRRQPLAVGMGRQRRPVLVVGAIASRNHS